MKVKNLVKNIGMFAAPVNLYIYRDQFKTERVMYVFFDKGAPVAKCDVLTLKNQGYWEAEVTSIGLGMCGSIEVHAVVDF